MKQVYIQASYILLAMSGHMTYFVMSIEAAGIEDKSFVRIWINSGIRILKGLNPRSQVGEGDEE